MPGQRPGCRMRRVRGRGLTRSETWPTALRAVSGRRRALPAATATRANTTRGHRPPAVQRSGGRSVIGAVRGGDPGMTGRPDRRRSRSHAFSSPHFSRLISRTTDQAMCAAIDVSPWCDHHPGPCPVQGTSRSVASCWQFSGTSDYQKLQTSKNHSTHNQHSQGHAVYLLRPGRATSHRRKRPRRVTHLGDVGDQPLHILLASALGEDPQPRADSDLYPNRSLATLVNTPHRTARVDISAAAAGRRHTPHRGKDNGAR